MNPWTPTGTPTGTVNGTLLNFCCDWDLWSPRMTQDPPKAAPKAPVLHVKTANTFCPAGRDLSLQDGVTEIDISDTISDNAANAGIVLGAKRVDPLTTDLPWCGAVLSQSGMVEEAGLAAGVQGHPAVGIAWRANKLALRTQHPANLDHLKGVAP